MVTLTAGNQIGIITPPITVTIDQLRNNNLTQVQRNALAAGFLPGDTLAQGVDQHGNVVTYPADQTPAGVTLTGYVITLDHPLLVQAGSSSPTSGLWAVAPNGVDVLQVQGDLLVNNVNAPNGPVHIASQGDIFQNGASVNNFGVNGVGWVQNSSPRAGSLINNDVLTLTDGGSGEARSAWFNTQVPTGSFQASFTYNQNNGNFGGDGIAFVLQTDSHGTSSLGAAGGGLGYGGAGFTITPSIGYEINIYSGVTQGTNLLTNGAVGSYNPTGSVSLIASHPIEVVLTYDSAHSTFTEQLTDTVNGQTYSHQYTNFNIASILNSSSAYMGFTGGSGSAMAVQTISNFSFVSMAADPIVGQTIALTAGRQIGRQHSPVMFQTTTTTEGNINATAQADINLAAQAGAVNVGAIQNTNGNITLTAISAANQQIGLSGSSIISAQHGSISLSQTADTFTAPAGSTLAAGHDLPGFLGGDDLQPAGQLHGGCGHAAGGQWAGQTDRRPGRPERRPEADGRFESEFRQRHRRQRRRRFSDQRHYHPAQQGPSHFSRWLAGHHDQRRLTAQHLRSAQHAVRRHHQSREWRWRQHLLDRL